MRSVTMLSASSPMTANAAAHPRNLAGPSLDCRFWRVPRRLRDGMKPPHRALPTIQ